ncbi:MAG: hypothetical protein JXB46_05865 [Candidatus Eisenbacteria bacterium]|nr:hypothetical protein [Candidatus Eisenbacteria bacterium]
MDLRRVAGRALTAAVGVCLLLSGCGGGGTGGREIVMNEPVRLTRTFEQGQTIKYKLVSAGELAIAMQGFDRVGSTQTEFRTTCDFKSVSPDAVIMEMRFDHAASSVSFGDDVTINESAGALRGKTLEVTLKPDGEVVSFSGLSNEAYFDQGAGEISLMMQGMFPVLPEGPIDIGYTWQEDLDVPDITSSTDRDFIGETTYTVSGFKEKYGIPCVEVKTVSSFEFEGRVEQQGEAWLMSGTGSGDGTILFSVNDGLILYSTGITTMDFTGEGSTTAGAAASTTLSAGLRVQATMELL